MQRIALLHPLLMAVAPILLLGAANIDQVDFEALLLPGLVSLAATALVYLFLWSLRGDAQRAAAIAWVGLVLFFSYGHLFQTCWGLHVFTRMWHLEWLLWAVSLLVMLSAGTLLWRTRRNLARLTQFLAITSAVLLGVGVREIVHELKHSDVEFFPQQASKPSKAGPTRETPVVKEDTPSLPDIYYIILDGYARHDVLQEIYEHDNSGFLNYLDDKGFYVAKRSHTNYPMTFLSLASSLNMRYVNEDTEKIGVNRRRRWPIKKLIRDNEVGRRLRAKGYRYVTFSTNWGATYKSYIADITYSPVPPFFQNEFLTVLMRTTMLRSLAPSVARSHLYTLEKLKHIPNMKGPTFTFAHLLMPHNPYVFDRHGNIQHDIPLSLQFDDSTGGWQNRQGYVEQLLFLNRKMREVIDAIIARSAVPPIIIVQADHGSAVNKQPREPAVGNEALIRERMAIFNAYYVPRAFRQRLYPDITPVNSFRLLFATIFGEEMEPLPDRTYFSWYTKPYRMADVTKLLASEPKKASRLAN